MKKVLLFLLLLYSNITFSKQNYTFTEFKKKLEFQYINSNINKENIEVKNITLEIVNKKPFVILFIKSEFNNISLEKIEKIPTKIAKDIKKYFSLKENININVIICFPEKKIKILKQGKY